jgi:uncharacterized protein (DUF305 family)
LSSKRGQAAALTSVASAAGRRVHSTVERRTKDTNLGRSGIARVALVLSLAGAAAASGIAAAGCGGDDDSNQASANPIDRAFAADMIPHHEGAIEMAELVRERAEHREVKQLADDIVAAQEAEIGTLRRIEQDLEGMGIERGDLGLDEHERGMGHDLAELEQAEPFDRTFIELMIAHHEGAIRMARSELADGAHKALQKIAWDITAAQSREIAQMRSWSKRWYGTESGEPHVEGSM